MNEALRAHFEALHRQSTAPIGLLSGWTFSSDGHVLVAVEGDMEIPWKCASPTALKYCQDFLGLSPTGSVVRMDALREWSRAHSPASGVCQLCKGCGCVPCRECSNGKKVCECDSCGNEHEADCEVCDGSGSLSCEGCSIRYQRSPGLFGALILDRCLLANGLLHLPGDTARVCAEVGLERLLVFGDGWRLVVMAMRGNVMSDTEGEPFEVSA